MINLSANGPDWTAIILNTNDSCKGFAPFAFTLAGFYALTLALIARHASLTHSSNYLFISLLILNNLSRVTFFLSWAIGHGNECPTMTITREEYSWTAYLSNLPAHFYVSAFSIVVYKFSYVFHRVVRSSSRDRALSTLAIVLLVLANVFSYASVIATFIQITWFIDDKGHFKWSWVQSIELEGLIVVSSLMAVSLFLYGVLLYYHYYKLIKVCQFDTQVDGIQPQNYTEDEDNFNRAQSFNQQEGSKNGRLHFNKQYQAPLYPTTTHNVVSVDTNLGTDSSLAYTHNTSSQHHSDNGGILSNDHISLSHNSNSSAHSSSRPQGSKLDGSMEQQQSGGSLRGYHRHSHHNNHHGRQTIHQQQLAVAADGTLAHNFPLQIGPHNSHQHNKHATLQLNTHTAVIGAGSMLTPAQGTTTPETAAAATTIASGTGSHPISFGHYPHQEENQPRYHQEELLPQQRQLSQHQQQSQQQTQHNSHDSIGAFFQSQIHFVRPTTSTSGGSQPYIPSQTKNNNFTRSQVGSSSTLSFDNPNLNSTPTTTTSFQHSTDGNGSCNDGCPSPPTLYPPHSNHNHTHSNLNTSRHLATGPRKKNTIGQHLTQNIHSISPYPTQPTKATITKANLRFVHGSHQTRQQNSFGGPLLEPNSTGSFGSYLDDGPQSPLIHDYNHNQGTSIANSEGLDAGLMDQLHHLNHHEYNHNQQQQEETDHLHPSISTHYLQGPTNAHHHGNQGFSLTQAQSTLSTLPQAGAVTAKQPKQDNVMSRPFIVSVCSAICFCIRVGLLIAMSQEKLKQGPEIILIYSFCSELVPINLLWFVFEDKALRSRAVDDDDLDHHNFNGHNSTSYGAYQQDIGGDDDDDHAQYQLQQHQQRLQQQQQYQQQQYPHHYNKKHTPNDQISHQYLNKHYDQLQDSNHTNDGIENNPSFDTSDIQSRDSLIVDQSHLGYARQDYAGSIQTQQHNPHRVDYS